MISPEHQHTWNVSRKLQSNWSLLIGISHVSLYYHVLILIYISLRTKTPLQFLNLSLHVRVAPIIIPRRCDGHWKCKECSSQRKEPQIWPFWPMRIKNRQWGGRTGAPCSTSRHGLGQYYFGAPLAPRGRGTPRCPVFVEILSGPRHVLPTFRQCFTWRY